VEHTIGQVMIDEQGEPALLVHYAYRTGNFVFCRGKKVRKSQVACQPTATGGWQATNDVRAVNCPICQTTTAFKVASEPAKEIDGAQYTHLSVQGECACEGRKEWRRSAETVVVDCPMCRETKAFQKCDEELAAALAALKR